MDKYQYLTGKDLSLKPNTFEQAGFEYSPLGKIFNKGLDNDDQKEGLFKSLENIKDKQGEKQLKELKNMDKNKTQKVIDKISKNGKANNLLLNLRNR